MESNKQHISLFHYRKNWVIKALVNANRRITTREIEFIKFIILWPLKGQGLISKLDAWVLPMFSQREISSALTFVIRFSNITIMIHFWSMHIMTYEEQWILYNVKRKRWLSSKDKQAETKLIFTEKRRCYIFCGILKWMLLQGPELINRKGFVFHQDMAILRTSLVTRLRLHSMNGIQCQPTISGTIRSIFVSVNLEFLRRWNLYKRKSKTIYISFLQANIKNFISIKLCNYLKDDNRCWTRMTII